VIGAVGTALPFGVSGFSKRRATRFADGADGWRTIGSCRFRRERLIWVYRRSFSQIGCGAKGQGWEFFFGMGDETPTDRLHFPAGAKYSGGAPFCFLE